MAVQSLPDKRSLLWWQRRPSWIVRIHKLARSLVDPGDGGLDSLVMSPQNRSMVLMLLAQMVSSGMAVAAKLLQTVHMGMGPLVERQALITIMSISTICTWIWMYFARVPDAPLGERSVRCLLNIRGVAGVVGLAGFYFSLRYLTVSEAVMLNFLAPMVATFALGVIQSLPSGTIQCIAGIMSLIGVTLIAQPWHKISGSSAADGQELANGHLPYRWLDSALCQGSKSHSLGVVGALLGVAGGAVAYVVMGMIDKRAHPLITVHYFAAWTVVLSSASLIFMGTVGFRMPILTEWILLFCLGIGSPILQSLVAASLHGRGSLAALNMTYTQIVFSLCMDKIIWNLTPNWIALVGGGIIVASVVVVAMTQQQLKAITDVGDEYRGIEENGHGIEMINVGEGGLTWVLDYNADELSPGYDL